MGLGGDPDHRPMVPVDHPHIVGYSHAAVGERGEVMVKTELMDAVADIHKDVPKKEIEKVVDTIFDSIAEALERNCRVEIRGFGSFSPKARGAREGRNPRTGEIVQVPNKRIPFFKVGKELMDRVNRGRHH